MPSPVNQDAQYQTAADDWLRDTVRRCARAYRALSMYQCQEAMNEIDSLPGEVRHSAWALDIIARSYYEMANYVLVRFFLTSMVSWLINLIVGPESLQGSAGTGTLSPRVDGTLLHSDMAHGRHSRPVPPVPDPHVDQQGEFSSVDSCRKLFFRTEGSR